MKSTHQTLHATGKRGVMMNDSTKAKSRNISTKNFYASGLKTIAIHIKMKLCQKHPTNSLPNFLVAISKSTRPSPAKHSNTTLICRFLIELKRTLGYKKARSFERTDFFSSLITKTFSNCFKASYKTNRSKDFFFS